MQAPRSWPSRAQNHEKQSSVLISHPVYGILLQLRQTGSGLNANQAVGGSPLTPTSVPPTVLLDPERAQGTEAEDTGLGLEAGIMCWVCC